MQPARDSQLGVTDYRMGGRFQTDHPTHFPTMVIQNSLMPKKTSLPKARILLTVKGICPIHAEPIQRLVGTASLRAHGHRLVLYYNDSYMFIVLIGTVLPRDKNWAKSLEISKAA